MGRSYLIYHHVSYTHHLRYLRHLNLQAIWKIGQYWHPFDLLGSKKTTSYLLTAYLHLSLVQIYNHDIDISQRNVLLPNHPSVARDDRLGLCNHLRVQRLCPRRISREEHSWGHCALLVTLQSAYNVPSPEWHSWACILPTPQANLALQTPRTFALCRN